MADEQTESCPAQSFRRPFITDTIKNLNTKLLFIWRSRCTHQLVKSGCISKKTLEHHQVESNESGIEILTISSPKEVKETAITISIFVNVNNWPKIYHVAGNIICRVDFVAEYR